MAQGSVGEDFAAQFGHLAKEVFREIVRDKLAHGVDPIEQAQAYTARGKPDFVLAYLLVAPLADDEKREIYAQAFERRAVVTEERAREFDRRFHRSFALLFTEAGKDREAARRIRAGRSPFPSVRRPLPTL